jgi:hypothetical protein
MDDPHDSKNAIDWRDTPLVPGKRYRVSFNDCCANGWFEGIFTGGDPDVENFTFDCGEIAPMGGQTWITNASAPPAP